jgi:hypothetical protein
VKVSLRDLDFACFFFLSGVFEERDKGGVSRRRRRRRVVQSHGRTGGPRNRNPQEDAEADENLVFETSAGVEVISSFDQMGIRDLLRGVYAYGFEKPFRNGCLRSKYISLMQDDKKTGKPEEKHMS